VEPNYTYVIDSGKMLLPSGLLLATGYSGAPGAVNDPSKQSIPDVGPIPEGTWIIGETYDDLETGEDTLPLTPAEGTDTFGRSEFRIHGDSIQFAGQMKASKGCIILSKYARDFISRSSCKTLVVINLVP
jgi:Protein of unknown function (DUF2778)